MGLSESLASFETESKTTNFIAMKNLKTLFAILLVAAFSQTAFAQVDIDSDITVDVVVVTALTVTNSANIDLGTINAGLAINLDPNPANDANNTNIGIGFTRGQVDIAGEAGNTVIVTYNNASMDDVADSDFVVDMYSDEKTGGAGVVASGDELTLDGSGDATLTVGGDIAGGLIAGTYTSDTDITVTVNYN